MKTWVLTLLPVVTVMGFLSTGASVGAAQTAEVPRTERTADGLVGASISHPEGWVLQGEAYTYNKTYGFTLWRTGHAAADHGGPPFEPCSAGSMLTWPGPSALGELRPSTRSDALQAPVFPIGPAGSPPRVQAWL